VGKLMARTVETFVQYCSIRFWYVWRTLEKQLVTWWERCLLAQSWICLVGFQNGCEAVGTVSNVARVKMLQLLSALTIYIDPIEKLFSKLTNLKKI
jgi:hypothetical protein